MYRESFVGYMCMKQLRPLQHMQLTRVPTAQFVYSATENSINYYQYRAGTDICYKPLTNMQSTTRG